MAGRDYEKDMWKLEGAGKVLGKYRIVPRSGKGARLQVWVKAADFDKQWEAKQAKSGKKDGARIKLLRDVEEGDVLSGSEFTVL